MLAESESGGLGAGAVASTFKKKWCVTEPKGFEEWQLAVDAVVAADAKSQIFRGIDEMTPALVQTGVPNFTSLPLPKQQETIVQCMQKHEEANNNLYLKVLQTVDLSTDSTLMRKINSDLSPQPGRPARVWQLLALLRARGDKALRTNQSAIEQRVDAFEFPFGKQPAEGRASSKHSSPTSGTLSTTRAGRTMSLSCAS